MVELAYRGGIVADRLIGDTGSTAAALAARVRGALADRCELGSGEPSEVELGAAAGFVEPSVRAEFPGLRLDWLTVARRGRASPPRGQAAPADALQPLPGRERGRDAHAADPPRLPRVLPPDRARPRRHAGSPARRRRSRGCCTGSSAPSNLVDDALLIALIETGVPVWALDADVVDAGGLGIRHHGRRRSARGRVRQPPAAGTAGGRRRELRPRAAVRRHRARARRERADAPASSLFAVGVDGRAGDPRRGGAVGVRRGARVPASEPGVGGDPRAKLASAPGKEGVMELLEQVDQRSAGPASALGVTVTEDGERAAPAHAARADRAARARARRRVRDRLPMGGLEHPSPAPGRAAAARPR